MPRLSIVIPVYNAAATIAALTERLLELLAPAHPLEIVLVNDNSQDTTDMVCKELVRRFPGQVVYLRLAKNFGEHNAVMAGLNQTRGEVCVIMDDDFQNPPEEVPKLLAAMEHGYDVVYCTYGEKRDSLFRNLGSYLNGSMARIVLHKPTNLYLSSFKALNRFLVDEIIRYQGPTPYLDAIILRSTSNIGVVEVRHDLRSHGRSGYTWKKLLALWGNMLVGYSLVPIRILGAIGLLLTLLGLYSVGDMLLRDLSPAMNDPSDLEQLTSVTMFFRGFQLLATSLVGEYAGRIYLHLNRDPQFIIRERCQAATTPAGETP